jgi:hypothetical protein
MISDATLHGLMRNWRGDGRRAAPSTDAKRNQVVPKLKEISDCHQRRMDHELRTKRQA